MSIGQLAHYELQERIGRGALGVIFRARDHRLHCDVALKILTDPRYRGHLLQEARAEANLNHPNIARCFAIEEIEIDDPNLAGSLGISRAVPQTISFMSMEFVDGRGLDSIISEGALPIEKAIDFAIQIAEGLEAAHASSVVHRDLKPANIVVNGEGRLKILDFGLANIRSTSWPTVSDASTDALQTPPGNALVGTFGYMAPEIVDGQCCDERADLYALGVILYEMVTGHRPYPASNLAELQELALSGPPAPVSRFVENVPAGLEDIVRGLLQPKPKNRYAKARAVAEDLRLVRDGTWVSMGTKSAHAIERSGTLRVAAFALVLAFLLLILNWPWGSSPTPHDLFVGGIADIGDGSCAGLAEGLSSSFVTDLVHLNALNVLSPSDFHGAGREENRARAQRVGAGSILEGTIQCDPQSYRLHLRLIELESERVLWSERFEGPLDQLFAIQAQVASEVAESLELSLGQRELEGLTGSATSRLNDSRSVVQARRLLERFSDARAIDEAITLLDRAIANDPEFAFAHAVLGEAWLQKHEVAHDPQALEHAEASARIAARLDPLLIDAQVVQAAVWTDRGQLDEAKSSLRSILALRPEHENARFRMAVLEEKSGDSQAAIEELERNLRAHPESWRSWDYMGALLHDLGRTEEARRAFGEAIDRCPEGVVRPYANYATMELDLGHPQRAMAIYERVPAEYHSSEIVSNIGFYHWLQGDLEQSAQQYARAAEMDPEQPVHSYNLGDIQMELGDEAAARKSYLEASRRMRQIVRREPDNVSLRSKLAVMMAKSGDCAAALRELPDDADERLANATSAYEMALVRALCSEAEEALAAVRRAIELGCPTARIRGEIGFTPLHQNPEFRRLAEYPSAEESEL